MASTTDITNSALISQLNAGSSTAKSTTTKNGEVSKEQFLQLLVTQLKNQDPLDPMKNDQFAVDLAQFSQLEQLMDINKKIGQSSGSGDLSSLISYLGHEVTLNTNEAQFASDNGGHARFELVSDVRDAKVQVLDQSGNIVAEKDLGAVSAGKHSVALEGMDVPNGDYKLQLQVLTIGGNTQNVEVYAAGVVSGFIPGDDPTLMIGNRELKLTDIKQVNLAG